VKRKKEKKSDNIIWFDTSCKYIVPLVPSTNSRFDFTEKEVEVNILQNADGCVCIKKEGYQTKYIWDKSFEFLLYTKYVRKVRNEQSI